MEDPRIGTVLDDRYQILDRIAAGGMGVVYRGERLKLGRSVAIKFLHAWMATDSSFLKRFEIEARAMARLQHPNCTSVIDFGVDREEPYVVMDLAAGEALRALMDRGRLPVARAIEIARQVLAGLSHAHQQGITHRDIKPENIMVDSSPEFGVQVRILDFGLAKMREASTNLTTGFVVGTPDYMAPEQTLAQAVDARTDVYAVGVVLFEMLAGQKPFCGDSASEVIRMHREVPAPRVGELAPEAGISAALEAVVARALAKLPADRYLSAAELAAALDATPEAGPSRPGTGSEVASPSADSAPRDKATLGTADTAILQSDALMPVESGVTPGATPTRPLLTASETTPLPALTTPSETTPLPALTTPSETTPLPALTTPLGPAPATPPGVSTAPGAALPAGALTSAGSSMAPPDPHLAPGPYAPPSGVYGHTGPMPAQAGRRTPLMLAGAGALALVVALVVWGFMDGGADGDSAVAAGADPSAHLAAPAEHDGTQTTTTPSPRDPAASAPDHDADEDGEPDDRDPDADHDGPEAHPSPATVTDTSATSEPPELTAIKQRLQAGRTAGAIKALERLKRRHPDNAEIPYILGQLYFGKLWVSDGIKASRQAISRNPQYRSDAELIRSAIIGLASEKQHTQARRFLVREIGKPAAPYLEEAAQGHQSDRIRERAARALAELR